jgi:hypothetical protein
MHFLLYIKIFYVFTILSSVVRCMRGDVKTKRCDFISVEMEPKRDPCMFVSLTL